MAKKRNPKVRKMRKPLNINVGVIIFAIIFVYLAFSVTAYLSKDKIQFYEVVEGGIVSDQSHTGLILRQEEVKKFYQCRLCQFLSERGKTGLCGYQNLFPG